MFRIQDHKLAELQQLAQNYEITFNKNATKKTLCALLNKHGKKLDTGMDTASTTTTTTSVENTTIGIKRKHEPSENLDASTRATLSWFDGSKKAMSGFSLTDLPIILAPNMQEYEFPSHTDTKYPLLLGNGSHSIVLNAKHKTTNEPVAVKVQIIGITHTAHPYMDLLGQDLRFMRTLLNQNRCATMMDWYERIDIPKSYYSPSTTNKRKSKTQLHAAGIVHTDLQPNNFCLETIPPDNTLYNNDVSLLPSKLILIDFGNAERYTDLAKRFATKEGQAKGGAVAEGTFPFNSTAGHAGKLQSYKDDVQSVLFILWFLLDGELPWSCLDENSKHNFLSIVFRMHTCSSNWEQYLPTICIISVGHSGFLVS